MKKTIICVGKRVLNLFVRTPSDYVFIRTFKSYSNEINSFNYLDSLCQVNAENWCGDVLYVTKTQFGLFHSPTSCCDLNKLSRTTRTFLCTKH
jgi:hypothetical protein